MPRKVVEVAAVEALIDNKVSAGHEKIERYKATGNDALAKDMEARIGSLLVLKSHLKFLQQFDMD